VGEIKNIPSPLMGEGQGEGENFLTFNFFPNPSLFAKIVAATN
jgi:hypothetical protein